MLQTQAPSNAPGRRQSTPNGRYPMYHHGTHHYHTTSPNLTIVVQDTAPRARYIGQDGTQRTGKRPTTPGHGQRTPFPSLATFGNYVHSPQVQLTTVIVQTRPLQGSEKCPEQGPARIQILNANTKRSEERSNLHSRISTHRDIADVIIMFPGPHRKKKKKRKPTNNWLSSYGF